MAGLLASGLASLPCDPMGVRELERKRKKNNNVVKIVKVKVVKMVKQKSIKILLKKQF